MLKFTTSSFQEASSKVLILVVFLEDVVQDLPEALLPLEDGLLRHDIRHDLLLQAALEEDVREVVNIVQRVVVHDDTARVVFQLPRVDDHRLVLHVLGEKGREHTALGDLLPAGAVLATDGVPLEEHGGLEAELDAGDVDGVARDRDAVPAFAHGAVRGAQRLHQAHGLRLLLRGCDRRLLEDGPDPVARLHGVSEHLVAALVASLAAEVVEFPLRGLDDGLHPALEDQLHGVVRHLLAGDVGHRWGRDLVRGEGADPQATWGSPREAAERAQHREGAGWKTNPHG
mmetsp:Transcript_52088/g.149333  ORF Transcript_52088/g.149333 Transcript_52088/m.149333 type:complete len:286 (-) Transcript_52088:61-918(-)